MDFLFLFSTNFIHEIQSVIFLTISAKCSNAQQQIQLQMLYLQHTMTTFGGNTFSPSPMTEPASKRESASRKRAGSFLWVVAPPVKIFKGQAASPRSSPLAQCYFTSPLITMFKIFCVFPLRKHHVKRVLGRWTSSLLHSVGLT